MDSSIREAFIFVKSMTGYARITRVIGDWEIGVEVRSINHRYLECTVKVPHGYGFLEGWIRTTLQEKIHRGKVEVNLSMRCRSLDETVTINHEMACAYINAIYAENKRLAGEFNGVSTGAFFRDDLGLSTLLRLPEVFTHQEADIDENMAIAALSPIFAEALDTLCQMRTVEGEKLCNDIQMHLDQLEAYTRLVEQLVPESVQSYHEKLQDKLIQLLGDNTLDETRLVTEVGILAEKVAVDEEISRLYSHISQFRAFLNEREPVGRRMDFLVQEMNREVNTTGAKSQSLEITRLVVDMKAEIEKIREQIQNIE